VKVTKKKVRRMLKPHYSGNNSINFWKFINSHKKHSQFYLLGVILQNIEETILKELNDDYYINCRGDK